MFGKLDICQEWAFVIVMCIYVFVFVLTFFVLVVNCYQYVVKVVNIQALCLLHGLVQATWKRLQKVPASPPSMSSMKS